MPDETLETTVSAKVVETDEEPFKPDKTIKLEFELEPLEEAPEPFYSPDWLDYWPNTLPPYLPSYSPVPEFEDTPKELIINIETTGTKPWESRLIMIGVLDPNALEPQAINFIEETELQTLNAFLEWWKSTNYTTLIGYNVSFDYRFLYALMQKYRKNAPTWKNAELYDLMQQQKQVKSEFVFGYNPTGKLEEWSTYLLGTQPYAPQENVYKWHKEKNIDELVNFNTDKLTKAYFLWVLDKVVSGTIPGAEVLARPGSPTTATPEGQTPGSNPDTGETVQVQCPNCLQIQEMPKKAKVINCFVCKAPIANPAV